MIDLHDILAQGLTDPEAGWNMGSFGAIAEFHHVSGDPAPQPQPALMQVTDRGGVRIDRREGVPPSPMKRSAPVRTAGRRRCRSACRRRRRRCTGAMF